MDRFTRPADSVIAYCAGFIDGEGCIGLNERTKMVRLSVSQSLENSGERVCQWFTEQWQLGKAYRYERATQLRTDSVMWTWDLNSRPAVAWVLECCIPYMIVKRAKAERVVEWVHSMPSKWTRWTAAEKQYLADHYPTSSRKAIAVTLGKTPGEVAGMLQLCGIPRIGGRSWAGPNHAYTEHEQNFVRDNMYSMSYREIAEHLERDHNSVSRYAKKLGFVGNRWSISGKVRRDRKPANVQQSLF